MTIRKLGFKWYVIEEIICNRFCSKQYMYYTKREALQLFKRDFEELFILQNEDRQDRKGNI